jgi:ABC-type glycerol-3-phosphate transport system substrate-binding protein
MPIRTFPLVPTIAIALAIALALAACSGDQPRGSAAAAKADSAAEVAESERFGGTLVIAASADIGDISPLTWQVQNALYMQQFVLFAPLIAYDPDLKPVPRLARS